MPDPAKKLENLLTAKARQLAAARTLGGNRCEFLVVWPQVEAAIARGYTVKLVWTVLHENGMIHCNYPWFARMVKQQRANARTPATPPPVVVTTTANIPPPPAKPEPVSKAGTPGWELPTNFGKSRKDLTLDDLFGMTDKNALDELGN